MFIGKRSNGIYFVEVFDPTTGKIRRVSTGTTDKAEAQVFMTKYAQNIYQPAKKKSKDLSSFMEEYLKYVGSNFSPNYLRSIELSFRMLIQFGGDIPISKINVKYLQQFFGTTFNRSQYAASMYLRTLKASFKRAKKYEYDTTGKLQHIS